MQTNAMLNNVFWNPLVTLPTAFAVSGERRKLNTSDAKIIPITNLGKRSQMTPAVGLVS